MSLSMEYTYPSRARKKMKIAKVNGNAVYISGMSGFGKTAFVTQYFTRKTALFVDGETIAVDEFKELVAASATKGKKLAIVVDNLQFADDIYVREYILQLLKDSSVWMILVSRAECPPWLAGYRFKGEGLVEISQEDLTLNADEITEYIEKNEVTLDSDITQKIITVSRGHGLILSIFVHLIKTEMQVSKKAIDFERDIFIRGQKALWDYVEQDVYERWEPWFMEDVMRLSIVDSFDKSLAEYITGNTQIELFFKTASEIGNFLKIVEGKYQMDIAVRNSAKRRMERTYSKKQRDELYYNAGRYYRQQGETVKALEMFKACDNEGQIYEILEEVARLNPGINRMYELRKYFFAMPEHAIRKSVNFMSGMSMLYAITMNYDESDYWYEQIVEMEKTALSRQKKEIKSTLAYLDIALPHRSNQDMITLIKNVAINASARKISLREFSVTANAPSNMNGGKDFCEWSKKDRFLAKSIGKFVRLALGKHGAGIVDLALAESFFEKGEDDYEVIRHITKGLIQAENGKIEECFVGEGLLSRLHLHKGNIEDAREILCAFRKKCQQENATHLLPNIDSYICRLDLYAGNSSEYMKWMNNAAPDEFADFFVMDRYCYLTKVRIYMVQGKMERAQSLIERLLYFAQKCSRQYLEMECNLLLAILQYRIGYEKWQDTFQKVYSKAEEYHFVRLISAEAGAVYELLKKAEFEVMDKKYYNQVLAETKNMADNYLNYLKGNCEEVEISLKALQVLRYQAQGKSNAEIAEIMAISPSTVKYHCKENYQKLGVSSKAAAVSEAQRRKLI